MVFSAIEKSTEKFHFYVTECLTDIRQILCAPKVAGKQEATDLSDLLSTMQSSLNEQVRTVLSNLKVRYIGDSERRTEFETSVVSPLYL